MRTAFSTVACPEWTLEDVASFAAEAGFGGVDLRSFGHRSRQKQLGMGTEEFEGKPVIAILNTWTDLIPCHSHFRQRAEDVKRGVSRLLDLTFGRGGRSAPAGRAVDTGR